MYNVCGVNVHVDFWKIELYAYLVSSWAPIMSFLDLLTVQFYQSTKRLLQFIGVIPILLLRIIGEKEKEKEETIGIQIFLETCSVHEHAILGKSQLSGSAFCSLCKPAGDLASSTSNQSNKFHRGIPYYCSCRPCMDFCFFYLLESFLIDSLFPKFFTSCCNAVSSNPICNILDHWFLLTCSYYVVISLQRHQLCQCKIFNDDFPCLQR